MLQNNEIDRLYSEIRDCEHKCNSIQRERDSLARSVKDNPEETEKYKNLDERHAGLQLEYDMLKKEYQRVQEAYDTACISTSEKQELEQIILKLRGQLQSLQRGELEKQDCVRKLNTAESTVKRLVRFKSLAFLFGITDIINALGHCRQSGRVI